jgi:hypothetical protein
MQPRMSDRLNKEFKKKYSTDFKVTGGIMETFQGIEVKQRKKSIKLHIDHYI